MPLRMDGFRPNPSALPPRKEPWAQNACLVFLVCVLRAMAAMAATGAHTATLRPALVGRAKQRGRFQCTKATAQRGDDGLVAPGTGKLSMGDTRADQGAPPVVPKIDAGQLMDPYGLLLKQRIIFIGAQVRKRHHHRPY